MTMQPTKARLACLAIFLSLSTACLIGRAAIESSFDDQVYPGTAGEGWVGGWQHTAAITPEIQTGSPIDGGTPYLNVSTSAGNFRNVARQFESGNGVDVTKPYLIRWKFRLNEVNFGSAFTAFNDRVHFFGRHAANLGGSTDANNSWSIMATGNEQTAGSGILAGQTFWIYDNVDGSGAFNLLNNTNTFIPLLPNNIYSFEMLIDPEAKNFSTAITNETSGAMFKSSAPHRFRDSTVTPTSHNFINLGARTSASGEARPYDLDSVTIVPWEGPVIESVTPAAYGIIVPTNGITFNVVSMSPVSTNNISLKLNDADVSDGLSFTGSDTNISAAYSGLATNQKYVMEITATNSVGKWTVTRTFYTASGSIFLYDSEGFTSDTLYPPGNLQAVTHGDATWQPGANPSVIQNDGTDGKVLDRENWTEDRSDYLHLPPLSSGTLTIEFKAKVSRADTRTFDLSLMPGTGGLISSMLSWGAINQKVAYYDGANWQPLADLDTTWHTYKIVNYLSGPAAGFYDVFMDGAPLAARLQWRNAIAPGTAFSRVRLHTDPAGEILEYGRIDDLVVTGAPEDPNAFPPPSVSNLSPFQYAVVRPGEVFSFQVSSLLPITRTNVSVILNGSDITGSLAVSGSNGTLNFSYNQLSGGQRYTAEVTATNTAGTTTVSHTITVIEAPLTLFDSQGFESDALYPPGPLQPTTDGPIVWFPATSPSEFVTVETPYNKVLRRGTSPVGSDFMTFPPVASGVLTIDFDALASKIDGRTIDFCLLWPNSGANQAMASFLSWGTVADNVSFYNGSAWVPVFAPGTTWNHYTTINYLSGPDANTFDLKINGVLVGQKLRFRNLFAPQTAVGRLRFGATIASAGHYGQFDNLIIKVEPQSITILSVTISSPSHTGTQFTFSFTSQQGTSHAVKYKASLSTGDWTTLETILGDGTQKNVTHTNPPPGALFYRIESTVP